MIYELNLRGFETHKIEVQTAGFFSGNKLFIDGQQAPKGPKRGQVTLRRSDGTEVVATWIPAVIGLDVPRLEINGELIHLVEPFQWYEWFWAALPVLLVFVGGALGGVIGVFAFRFNAKIFRMRLSLLQKFLLSAGISIMGALLYLLVSFILIRGVGHETQKVP